MTHTKLPPYGELEEDHQTDPRFWSKDQRDAAKSLDRHRKWKDMPSITDECSTGSYYGAVTNGVKPRNSRGIKQSQAFKDMEYVTGITD